MLTPTQTAQLDQIVPPAGGSSAPGGATGSSGGWYSQIAPTQTAPVQKEQVAHPDLGIGAEPVKNPITQMGDQASQGVQQAEQGYQDASQAKNPIQETEAGMKELVGGIGAVAAPLAPILSPISKIANDIGSKIGNTKAVSDWANQHPEAASALSRIATDVGNTSTVLGTVAGGEGAIKSAPETIESFKNGAGAIKEEVGNAAESVKNAGKVTPEQATANSAKTLSNIASEWKKPTEGSTPAFNNARDVLAKDQSIPQFLAEQKANPNAHINSQDRFETADTAQALRDTAGKMSNETLRPSLQAADYSTPKAKVSDIINQAVENANSDKSLTPGERATVVKNINKEGAALSKENPDGISLTNGHDSKITYAGKAGYSPIKSAADNATATANRHIASALQKDVEDRAPESVPVKDFNAYLSKYYKSADYLDALDGKKAPISWGKQLARAGGKLAGLAVGSHIGGGGILADVVGYRIGGVLEHAVEHMTSPARAHFLRNLEITNPKAFTQVQDYLTRMNTGKTGMLALPPATSETPIPLGAGVKTESVAPRAQARSLPVANPRTGRMMRTYTSEAEKP